MSIDDGTRMMALKKGNLSVSHLFANVYLLACPGKENH